MEAMSGPWGRPGDTDDYLRDCWGRPETMDVEPRLSQMRVTYPHPEGGKPFRVIVRQKPNPIGFHARLPGDL